MVICPVNTIKNWVEEFDKWLNGKDAGAVEPEARSCFRSHLTRSLSKERVRPDLKCLKNQFLVIHDQSWALAVILNFYTT